MSRDFMEDYLQHSWGKKPEQKAREKQYNAEYYQKHKDKWKDLNNDRFHRDAVTEAADANKSKQYWDELADKISNESGLRNWRVMNDEYQARKAIMPEEVRARARKRLVSSSAAKNEADKAEAQYRKNAKNAKTKHDIYAKNIAKDVKKHESAKKAKATIDAGKEFVANLLDKIF